MKTAERLYQFIKPSHYSLAIEPNFETFEFTCHETIDFELIPQSKQLIFHGQGLKIKSATVDGKALQTEYDDELRQITFTSTDDVSTGAHRLELEFTGLVQDSLHGFYKSVYAGGSKTLATTQFEAVHAREAIVCIDEPEAKATFDVCLIIPEDLTAISNTNVIKEEAADGKKRLTFATTPKMSTYLLAFLIGEFERATATTKGGVEVGVYTVPGKKDQTAFSLEVAIKSLDYYADYFGIPYPLPKLDMIAVPDFASGAMENWGAVTYREADLLIDDKLSSLGNRQRVAEVVAHELAHQWFGNLVTMEWWTDLWLNEGFATWVADLARDHLYAEWQIWSQFVTDNYAYAMRADSLINTRAVEVEVKDPRFLDEAFDPAISYGKGGCVVNMVYNYLGETDFRGGLHDYLQKHSYGNATTADLWEALGAASGKPVPRVMGAWISQPGFPIISAEDGQLTQRRFLADPKAYAGSDASVVWPVPVAAMHAGGQTDPYLLEAATADWQAPAGWYKLNPGQTGFYRVNYSKNMLNQLRQPIKDKLLPAIDRWGVLDDVLAGIRSGLASADLGLELIAALRDEDSLVVWQAMLGGIGAFESITPKDKLAQLDEFAAWLVQPILQKLGWDAKPGENADDTLLRSMIIATAGTAGDESVIMEARRRFENPSTLDANLRGPIFNILATNGSELEFTKFTEMFKNETQDQEKRRLLNTLAQPRDPQVVQKALEFAMSPAVRQQDTIFAFGSAATNRVGGDVTWKFIKDNWPEFLKRYGGGGHMLDHFPLIAAAGLDTVEQADDLENFFTQNSHPEIERPSRQAVERIRLKVDWAARDAGKVASFLDSFKYS